MLPTIPGQSLLLALLLSAFVCEKEKLVLGVPSDLSAKLADKKAQDQAKYNQTGSSPAWYEIYIEKDAPRFYINDSTRVVTVDKVSGTGYLIGDYQATSSPNEQTKARPGINESQTGQVNNWGATNFSVYLISRNKDHIAVILDVVDIDFDPVINCENQEIRLSIVGQISNQLLEERASGELAKQLKLSDAEELDMETDTGDKDEDVKALAADEQPSIDSNQHESSQEWETSMPVTEAMSLLLNYDLNRTILNDSEESNNFKIIDTSVDWVRGKVCRELRQTQMKSVTSASDEPVSSRTRSGTDGNQQGRLKSRRSRGRSSRRTKRLKSRRRCSLESDTYRKLMHEKLDEHFEWDEFRILCGKIRQLLIPLRSLKISVYSDEFTASSKFILRYRFISDPGDLPAKDNDKYYCRNRRVIELEKKCDGFDDCGDASDESTKLCGHHLSRQPNELQTIAPNRQNQEASLPIAAKLDITNSRRLVHYGAELPRDCCATNPWLVHGQLFALQSIIGDSMNLFSGIWLGPSAMVASDSATSDQKESKSHKHRVKRIVGGTEARRYSWPAQASFQFELVEPISHFCAGTLIHPQYVITAGHCITKDGMNRGIKVVFGAHDLRQQDTDQVQVRYVDDAQIYPGVDAKHLSLEWENDMNNDLALIRLNAPVILTRHVAPACLPSFNTPLPIGASCSSIGWGQTHGSGSSNLLKQLSLKVVNSSICSEQLIDRDQELNNQQQQQQHPPESNKQSKISVRKVHDHESSSFDQFSNHTMICVNNDLGHGICQGDSGGPLYCEKLTPKGEPCAQVYGVASFIIQYATVGAMCAVENLPGIFGEVSSKVEWIASTIRMFEQTYRIKYS